MDNLRNIVLQSAPIMKHPIPLHTTTDGSTESSPTSKHSEAESLLSTVQNSMKPRISFKSHVNPQQISQNQGEPRVLKVTKADIEMLAAVLKEGRQYMKSVTQK